jgi:Asp-tRNA(Asn)/Glu-tRNA(Gln) amidotransferase A subunit family amidase
MPDLAGLRLGIMAHPGADRFLQPAVRAAFESIVAALAAAGAAIRDVSIPGLEEAADALLTILGPEASIIHERRLATQPFRYAQTTRQQIEAGFAVPATAYVRARQVQRALGERFDHLFETLDAVLSPAVPWVAPAEDPAIGDEGGEGEMLYSGVYNLVGLPALSLPCGLAEGLPAGLQIVGPRRADGRILAIGAALEKLLPRLVPPL